jgi:hypothetical protein
MKVRHVLIVAVMAWLLLILVYLRCDNGGDNNNGTATDSLSYWKNKAGQLTASLSGSQADFAMMESYYLDSIAKVYRTKTRYIKSIVVVETRGETILLPSDSIYREYAPSVNNCPPQVKTMSQKFTNSYYKADVRIGEGSKMTLQSFDTLTLVWKRVRTGSVFSRRNSLQLDAANANPYVVVTGLKSFVVEEKKQKKFGIGLQAGYDIRGRSYIGVGVSYNLIKL